MSVWSHWSCLCDFADHVYVIVLIISVWLYWSCLCDRTDRVCVIVLIMCVQVHWHGCIDILTVICVERWWRPTIFESFEDLRLGLCTRATPGRGRCFELSKTQRGRVISRSVISFSPNFSRPLLWGHKRCFGLVKTQTARISWRCVASDQKCQLHSTFELLRYRLLAICQFDFAFGLLNMYQVGALGSARLMGELCRVNSFSFGVQFWKVILFCDRSLSSQMLWKRCSFLWSRIKRGGISLLDLLRLSSSRAWRPRVYVKAVIVTNLAVLLPLLICMSFGRYCGKAMRLLLQSKARYYQFCKTA